MSDEKIIGGEGKNQEEQKEAVSMIKEVPVSLSQETSETKVERESGKEQSGKKLDEILLHQSSSSPSSSSLTQDYTIDAKSIGEEVDEESKIQKLLDLANTKGVVHAVKVARSLSDYYVLDRMHDELVDKFYEGLLAKGMITKE